ncbi:MAG: hypothetical protein AAFX99_25060, partial [Myxococcota bacterium]
TIQLAPGVRLERLHGFAFTQVPSPSGNTITVPLGEFWSGRNASMLLQLKTDRSMVGQRSIAKVGLAYRDLAARQPRSDQGQLSAAVVSDGALVERHKDGEVAMRYEQFMNIAAQDEAMRRYESGDVLGANAILDSRKKALEHKVKEFESAGLLDEERARSFEKDRRQAEEATKAINALPASSNEGKRFLKRNRATNWNKSRSIY